MHIDGLPIQITFITLLGLLAIAVTTCVKYRTKAKNLQKLLSTSKESEKALEGERATLTYLAASLYSALSSRSEILAMNLEQIPPKYACVERLQHLKLAAKEFEDLRSMATSLPLYYLTPEDEQDVQALRKGNATFAEAAEKGYDSMKDHLKRGKMTLGHLFTTSQELEDMMHSILVHELARAEHSAKRENEQIARVRQAGDKLAQKFRINLLAPPAATGNEAPSGMDVENVRFTS